MPSPDPHGRFGQLIDELSGRLKLPLDPNEGMVVLVDSGGALRMVIELSADLESLYVVLPVLGFPDDEARLRELALEVLLLNADRHALRDASLCGDAHRSVFCLVKRLGLDVAPDQFLEELDALGSLADLVAGHLKERDAEFDTAAAAIDALNVV